VTLDEVQMRSIEWLDKPLWQRRAFHLLTGSKGAGKGTYTALLIAKITRGLVAEPRNVIIVSSEDSVEVDIKPRLVAAGADVARCHYITSPFRLPDDLDNLRATIREIGDVGLVLIDPLSNHTGSRSTNKEEEVRGAIAPLNDVADEHDLLIVGIRHIGKNRVTARSLRFSARPRGSTCPAPS
jgi:predicted ATP-dependent serine protease